MNNGKNLSFYVDRSELKDVANIGTPGKVGSLKPSELGIYDMHGNVGEMCRNSPYMYTSADVVDPDVDNYCNSAEKIVIRGGGYWGDAKNYFCYSAENRCRAASRWVHAYRYSLSTQSEFGFRVACHLE